MNRPIALVLALALPLAACASPDTTARASRSSAPDEVFPLLAALQGQHLEVSTDSAEAQRYFDQGLTLYWSFDHEEAQRSFRRAAELDPDLAMAHWGLAHAVGPHINNPTMDPERDRLADEAVRAALARSGGATPLERALIEAQDARYESPPPADRRHLDEAYAARMKAAWQAFPQSAEVGTLYAEALMDLRPWDLWTKDGEAQPETPEIVAVLAKVLALDGNHVGANHLAIHAWEMSPTPEKAGASADRLRTLVPGAAHLVHMPAHIDIRLGRYEAAVKQNSDAIVASEKRVERTGAGGFYAMYRAHNYHFLVYAAQFDGRYELALDTARELVRQMPTEVVDAFPEFVEGFLPTPLHVLVRFGKWNEILAEPEPPANRPGWIAFWRYARGLAQSALGNIPAAEAEQRAFEAAVAAVPENYSIGNNATTTVLDIGRSMLAGELEYRRGNHAAAFEHLRAAVAKDEALRYDEPWGWFQPAAHALGALLLEQGRAEEAEAVYRRDLELHPDNGWALHGLEECQRRLGRTAEADATRKRFEQSWKRADVAIEASCYCRTG
jgi:tetratricopeptide (TPR) repeat protein